MSSTRKAKNGTPPASEAASVIISLEERRRLKMEASAKRREELRAQKVRDIKARIAEGTYHVDAADVARSIVRRELARLLEGKRANSDKKKKS
jgi:flagellar biosynthesis anti-sigma factor FlgM